MANNANILLHGLFFLQYQGEKLIVMTPGSDHHQFLMRQQGQQGNHHQFLMRQQGQQGTESKPFPPLAQGIDYTNLVGGDTKAPFPTAMPQFRKSNTGVGDLVANPNPKNYRCRIELNFPLDIMVLRSGGRLSDYPMDANSTVGQDILNKSGPDLGLVTLLHYQTSDPSFTVSLFAEHRDPPQPDEMNPVLTAAKDLFSNGAAFDLQLVNRTGIPKICPDDPIPPKAQGYGVLRDDEHSFGEIYDNEDCAAAARPATDVANCVQYGLLD